MEDPGSTLQSKQQSLQQAENKRYHRHPGQNPGQIPNPKPAAKEKSLWHVKTDYLPKPESPPNKTPNQLK